MNKILHELYLGVKWLLKAKVIAVILLSLVLGSAYIISTQYKPIHLSHEGITEDPYLTFTKLKVALPDKIKKHILNARLFIVDSPNLNAYTDRQDVYITTAMLEYIENTDELAFLMGHELGHIIDFKYNNHIWIGPPSETRADIIGLHVANNAGYKGCKGAGLFFRLHQDFGDNKSHSHPMNSKRFMYTMCNEIRSVI